MAGIVAILWMIFQPLLFGLIGSEVDIAQIDGGTVGKFTYEKCQGFKSYCALYGLVNENFAFLLGSQ